MINLSTERKIIECRNFDETLLFDNFIDSLSVSTTQKIRNFYIPRHCGFLMTDILSLRKNPIIKQIPKSSILILDPPWPSKSVNRCKAYQTVNSLHSLRDIPVRELASEEYCLVCIWVTNNPKIERFVIDDLFPLWNVKYLNTWYWVKVACDKNLGKY